MSVRDQGKVAGLSGLCFLLEDIDLVLSSSLLLPTPSRLSAAGASISLASTSSQLRGGRCSESPS